MWQTLQMVSRRHLQWTSGWWLSHQPPSSQNSAGQPDSVCPAHCIKEGSRLCLGRSFESSLVDFRRKHWDIVLLSSALIVELWSRKHGPSLSFCIGLLSLPLSLFLIHWFLARLFQFFSLMWKPFPMQSKLQRDLMQMSVLDNDFPLAWPDLTSLPDGETPYMAHQ